MKRYTDSMEIIEYYQEYQNGGELVQYENLSQINPDIPDNLAFVDMGLTSVKNHLIDMKIQEDINGVTRTRRRMDAVDFRERCVVHNDRLYALYLKGPRDFQPTWYRRAEKLAEILDCPFDLATQVSEMIGRLGMKSQMARRLINGYVMQDGSRRPGLMGLKGDHAGLAELVKSINAMLDDVEKIDTDDGQAPTRIEDFYSDHMIYDVTVQTGYDEDHDDQDVEIDESWDDEMDRMGDSNPFGAFPLSDGTDGCEWEFLTWIRTGDRETINQVQTMMFSQNGKRAELWYLSPLQKTQVWQYIKDRKKQLAAQAKKNLGKTAKKVLALVRELGRGQYASSLIFAFGAGEKYERAGLELNFTRKATREELSVLWAEYKKLA